MEISKAIVATLLMVAASTQTVSANEAAADKRIDKVLAHFVAHPAEKMPVTNHPVRPRESFSRHYNVSRSARAYLQLRTDPSKDRDSSDLLKEVAQFYLDNPSEIPDPDSTYWAGEYHAAALAMFGSNGTVRKGAIARDAERKMLEYMVSYLNYWSRLEHMELSLLHQTYLYWSTENHWWQEVVTSWGYLLALKEDPEFKNTILDDGKTLQQHYDATVVYMKEHMRQRAKKGFLLEISSGGYAGRMHSMYYMIYEIAPEPELRSLAGKTLDLWWAFWVEEQLAGERGGGKVRHRRLRGLLPNSESHMVQAWLYFGAGTRNLDFVRGNDGDRSDMPTFYMATLSGYRPPEILYRIFEDRKSAPAYAITQRRLGKIVAADMDPEALTDPNWERFKNAGINPSSNIRFDFENGNVLKYSWVSPNFILGTNMRPPLPVESWSASTAQSWWHGLLLKSATSPFPERVVPSVIYNRDSAGEQYAVQSKTSFMTRKLHDARSPGSDNSRFPMGIYISQGLKGHTELDGDFIFIDGPTAWVAVRALNTDFSLANKVLSPPHQRSGDFYRLTEQTQPVVIEVAERSDYRNFGKFKEAARNAQVIYRDGAYHYDSLSGDRLTMFDDRSTPMINNAAINYHPEMAYSSRYISSRWDSGIITLTVGDQRHVLDFTVD